MFDSAQSGVISGEKSRRKIGCGYCCAEEALRRVDILLAHFAATGRV
jgi:hypothetical protein